MNPLARLKRHTKSSASMFAELSKIKIVVPMPAKKVRFEDKVVDVESKKAAENEEEDDDKYEPGFLLFD